MTGYVKPAVTNLNVTRVAVMKTTKHILFKFSLSHNCKPKHIGIQK